MLAGLNLEQTLLLAGESGLKETRSGVSTHEDIIKRLEQLIAFCVNG